MSEFRAHRPALAVDLDHTLTDILPVAIEWATARPNHQVPPADVTASSWIEQLMGSGDQAEEQLVEFFASAEAVSVAAVPGAKEVLKPLRKYFTLFALTDRPRAVEKATREWLDAHFGGVFDKLLFVDVDEHSTASLVLRKREMLEEFKVKVAVGSDAGVLEATLGVVDHAVVVGASETEMKEGSNDERLVHVAEWGEMETAIRTIIDSMELTPADKTSNGPKLARYTDDLVTVSARKSAPFYASMINAKFVVQKQKIIRLQAADRAITTAVQAAELVKTQQTARVTKIHTQYAKRFYDGESRREPKIEIELTKVPEAA